MMKLKREVKKIKIKIWWVNQSSNQLGNLGGLGFQPEGWLEDPP